ncbi:PROTEIN SODIUM POTASSIUM ROOT DEFECTIVE 2 [Salix purpurea]|uniref:PROTEIN SODIUM POTASSIUM ROOT DEFECTIVE 2 n=1 Tax=Salix purpurea TaxID=77065 RepID=A0A9Q0VW20_SALPP|nr:PROTEIN SODIUM POTASSIUM ROOT DEFECTIVE 2 [Salix purpurea]
MRKIDMFCASQASTAICMSMDRPSSSSTGQLGGPSIDRRDPISRHQKRIPGILPSVPCTSQPPPINPVPYQTLHKSQKITSKNKASDQSSDKKSNSAEPKPKSNDQKTKKISFKTTADTDYDEKSAAYLHAPKDIVRKIWAKPGGFIAPPGSSRYPMGDAASLNGMPENDPVLAQLVPVEPNRSTQALSKEESTASKPSSSSDPNQVVVLRVSLHCKGCEGKVRKHLSRMEGVTSFNIDFAAKKVTIVGDVTPLRVLASVSKIKSAQFWTSTTPTEK